MATPKKGAKIVNDTSNKLGSDVPIKMQSYIPPSVMKEVKSKAKANGMRKMASGISVSSPTYYNPLYTPTSLQLPRDRKQVNVWSFEPGTKIQMADGTQKLIEDISVGDFVRSANGHIRPVTHTYVNHVEKDMVTMTTADSNLSVTHDHICYVVEDKNVQPVLNGADIENYVTEKYASEVVEGDWTFRLIPQGKSNLLGEKLAYLLGMYLAEGYIYEGAYSFFDSKRQKKRNYTRKKACVELKLGLNEKPIVDKIVALCEDLGYETNVCTTKNVYRVLVLSDEYSRICESHCGRGSHNKVLSDDVLYAPLNVLQSFLSGYIDGDGHQTKVGEFHIATVSNNLSDQLRSVVFPRLGIIGGLTKYNAGKKLNGGEGYPVNHMRIPRRFAGLFEGHSAKPLDFSTGSVTLANKKRIRIAHGLVLSQIKKVEVEAYVGNVHDITVDVDFNVIANGYSVRQCRHFYETEAIPAAVIDLYSNLPITGFSVECENPVYKKYCEDMIDRLELRILLQGISLEYWKIGDCFIMGELDEEKADWKRFVVLNPDQIEVKNNMLIAEPYYEMIPDDNLKRLVYDQEPRSQYNELKQYAPDVIMAVRSGRNIPIDAAHVTHLKHTPTPYGTYGVPLLKRVFKTLMYKEMIRRAQFTIAERYVMPLKIFKLGTIDELPEQGEIDSMQEQITALLNDPSLVLVTHQRFQADWQGIAGKTLQLNGEYDFIEREIISGLGVSRAFLDGLGPTYANASIGGNAFLQKLENFRLMLKEFVEKKIFKPIAELNDWRDRDPDTDEEFLVIPQFKWDALRLQDELSRQQTLLQLRQMSIVSAKTMLDSLHIDAENEARNLVEERDTIYDASRIMARQMAIQMGLQAQMMKQQMDMTASMQQPTGGDPNSASAGAPEGDLLQGIPGSGDTGGLDTVDAGGGFSPAQSATTRPPVAASLHDEISSIKMRIEAALHEE